MLTDNHEVVDFYEACDLYNEVRDAPRAHKNFTRMLRYSVTVATHMELRLDDFETIGFQHFLAIILEQDLTKSKISISIWDDRFAELVLSMILQGLKFEWLHWILAKDFKMNECKWQLIRKCTSLHVLSDQLSDPTNPQFLSLPKLRHLNARQGHEEAARSIRAYNLPALEELVFPAVQFLRTLPANRTIKKLRLGEPTHEIIEIIAGYPQLESLTFCTQSETQILPRNRNLKHLSFLVQSLDLEELVRTVVQTETLETKVYCWNFRNEETFHKRLLVLNQVSQHSHHWWIQIDNQDLCTW